MDSVQSSSKDQIFIRCESGKALCNSIKGQSEYRRGQLLMTCEIALIDQTTSFIDDLKRRACMSRIDEIIFR